ncbi:MAG: hypothetical protein RRY79_03335 [Clostridia bacterium]
MKKILPIVLVLIILLSFSSCAPGEELPLLNAGIFEGVNQDPNAAFNPKLTIYGDDTYKLEFADGIYCLGSFSVKDEQNKILRFKVESFSGETKFNADEIEMLLRDDNSLLIKTELKGYIMSDTAFSRTLRGTPEL